MPLRSPEAADSMARDLLSKLTLDEKITLMSGDMSFYQGFLKLAAGDTTGCL